MKFAKGTTVIHVRTGHKYKVIYDPSECRTEATAEVAYAYQRVEPDKYDPGYIWVRSAAAMEDGRFTACPPGT